MRFGRGLATEDVSELLPCRKILATSKKGCGQKRVWGQCQHPEIVFHVLVFLGEGGGCVQKAMEGSLRPHLS